MFTFFSRFFLLVALVIFYLFTRQGFFIKRYLIILAAIIFSCIPIHGIWYILLKWIIVIIIIALNWLFYPWFPERGMQIFYGLPGCGKTSTASYIIAHSDEDKIYSNVPIKNTLKITRDMIGHVDISDGLLVIDEAGIDFNNRSSMNKRSQKYLDDDAIEWLKLFRHANIRNFVLFSQRIDIDVTLRGLAYCVTIIQPELRPKFLHGIVRLHVLQSRIRPETDKDHPFGEITQGFRERLSGIHWIWCRPYWNMFDSYDMKPLPAKEFEIWGTESKYAVPDQNFSENSKKLQ